MADAVLLLPLSVLDAVVFRPPVPPVVLAPWFVFLSLSYAIYSVLMHAKYGQTLGKMLTRIRVLDVSETKLSWKQAVLRDGVYIAITLVSIVLDLPGIVAGGHPALAPEMTAGTWFLLYGASAWSLAELATMLTNAKRRALHDFIAGSVVVRVGDPRI